MKQQLIRAGDRRGVKTGGRQESFPPYHPTNTNAQQGDRCGWAGRDTPKSKKDLAASEKKSKGKINHKDCTEAESLRKDARD
jgi:hypothetical protein